MIKQFSDKIDSYLKEKKHKEEQEKLLSLITAAKNEMQSIALGFNEVHDHDLTEYYIYQKRAAELKYMHLLKLYRESEFQNPNIFLETKITS